MRKIREGILEFMRHSTAKNFWKAEPYLTSYLPVQVSKGNNFSLPGMKQTDFFSSIILTLEQELWDSLF